MMSEMYQFTSCVFYPKSTLYSQNILFYTSPMPSLGAGAGLGRNFCPLRPEVPVGPESPP